MYYCFGRSVVNAKKAEAQSTQRKPFKFFQQGIENTTLLGGTIALAPLLSSRFWERGQSTVRLSSPVF